jgi:C4-type Zn-finger protein
VKRASMCAGIGVWSRDIKIDDERTPYRLSVKCRSVGSLRSRVPTATLRSP